VPTDDVSDCVTINSVVPHERYDPLWDVIVTSDDIKNRLLRSALLALTVRAKLPFHVTALHGLALLTGPPGTGKSTLARGLASKVAETLDGKARLIEINPHGLMSGEHGQSQRKVQKLFAEYVPLLADDGIPTVVLLDEVESMAVARGAASLAANPADVHRATDAVLTALDEMTATMPHVYVVATSNFTEALDDALTSRADVALSMPLPGAAAISEILAQTLAGFATAYPALSKVATATELRVVARKLVGMDGRRVRKLVTEAMQRRVETTVDPGCLTIDDLLGTSSAWQDQEKSKLPKTGAVDHGAH
jgi:pachytene checkpoint protein 2